MSFSPEWNGIYGAGKQITRWPWTDLVSAVKRHCGDIQRWEVLELGCGCGANAPFFVAEDAHYFGMDGSKAGLDLSGYNRATLIHSDFTDDTCSFGSSWDLICDRAAVTHNDTAAIRRCLQLVFNALKPGGWYIGIDWFSVAHADSELGEPVDAHTQTNILTGQFAGVGKVHFTSHEELIELFQRFEIVSIKHKLVDSVDGRAFGSFNIVARKPA